MRRFIKHIFHLFVLLSFLSGCNNKNTETEHKTVTTKDFSIKEFDALTNCMEVKNDSIYSIELDYFNAINTGFIIPTVRQLKEGDKFICRFKIKNNTSKDQPFSYKIFYQNESYKFPEIDSSGNKFNPYSIENFYGSWDDSTILFRKTPLIPSDGEYHTVIDSIRITGNPRNEEICYVNGRNDRWKRNPRVGVYSFFMAVTSEKNISGKLIPDYIQNISKKNGDNYLSPYYYFRNGDGLKLENTAVIYSSSWLKVIAHPNLGSGIFIDNKYFSDSNIAAHATKLCGLDTNLYKTAAFTQMIHYIDNSTRLENIPVIADVLKDNYSKRDYNWNRSFYKKEELISGTPMTANSPCQTVYSDPINKKIILHNPKSVPGRWRKENVGVVSRHGLAYGKIRVKAKLTELLNKNNMWNGLTNAIWMITQSQDNWNLLRPCNKEGYMATYWGGHEDKRVPRVGYSEIDFEILKTPSYCPDQTFPPVYKNPYNNPNNIDSWNTPTPEEILKDDGNISVACTNWDMACWDPENFGVGCKSITYEGKQFESHRWDHWYRAITQKNPQPDDVLFGSKYYYFEIDWRPTEIIWRIGPEPDKMFVVGYMNDKITSIPNNQMLLIVTQEFHNTQWWPGSPYQQKFIPFPANDIFGEIYEVTIE